MASDWQSKITDIVVFASVCVAVGQQLTAQSYWTHWSQRLMCSEHCLFEFVLLFVADAHAKIFA